MRLVRRVTGGFRALFQKTRVERELDEELREFLDASIEQKTRAGVSRTAATRAARAELGSREAVKDRVRDVGWESVLEGIWRDVRYSIRSLRRSPGFTAVAVLTLALVIGATAAIFSLLDAVLLKSLPVRNPEELVQLRPRQVQYLTFQAFRRHTETFVDLFASSGITPLDAEIENGARERTNVSLVSGSYFSVLGVQAAIGRAFTADDDDVPGEHRVAVASQGYWQRRFGGDAGLLNRVIRVSGTSIIVIGVAPPGFFGEQAGVAPDLWVPLTMWGQIVPGRNLLQSPGTACLRIMGRVRPGVITSGVHPGLTGTFQQTLTTIFGPHAPEDVRRDIAKAAVILEPAGRGVASLSSRFARPLQLLMGAVLLVLLIACANIANLLLARTAARRREIDLRLALGTSRARLVGQLFTESLILGAIGGGGGVAFAWLGREAILRLISADGSRLPLAVGTDARLLGFVAGVSILTAILFSLAPAWQAGRASVMASLVTSRAAGGRSRQRLSSVLVASQVAITLTLVTGAGLFLRTIANLRGVDLGFDPERLIVLDVNPQSAGYRGDEGMALNRRLLERIKGVPGVRSVSLSENGVLMGRDSRSNLLAPEGFVGGPEGFPQTQFDWVGPQYFATAGTPLLSGRDFNDRDDAGAPSVVAINEEVARQFFAGGNPIGRRLLWGNVGEPRTALEIVAVARDVKQTGPRDEPQLRIYLPYFQLPQIRRNWVVASTRFLVRTATSPAGLASILRQLIPSEDPRLSVESLDLGPELVRRTLAQERMVATLLVAFGVLATGLACLGLYGLVAYQVVQRTSEIGIRMALGARRGDVLRGTLRPALAWIATGVAIGIPLAAGASRFAESLLFGLSGTDVGTLIGAAGLMCVIGLLAAYVPARRATHLDPLVALRHD